jgi:hypothetical protein
MGKRRVLVGELEGRRPLERPRRRWVDNIKINLQEVGWTRSVSIRRVTGGGLL